jgi:hypothetical protein
VVIMHPNEVAVLDIPRNGLSKEPVCLLVSVPSVFGEGDFARMIVKEGPKNGVYRALAEKCCQRMIQLTGETVVVAIGQFVGDENWSGIVLVLQTAREAINLVFGNLETWPAIPLEGRGLGKPA